MQVGEILYSLPNNLNWKIPKLSDLPQINSRIYSPKFGSQTIPMKFDDISPGWHFYLMSSSGKKAVPADKVASSKMIKLSVTFESEDTDPIDWIRVGVMDETGAVINICDCIWSYTFGVYSEVNLVKEHKLKLRQCGAIPNGYLQLYCEIPSNVSPSISDDGTQIRDQTDKNSVASSSSASTINISSISGWECESCLINNFSYDIKCVACDLPKAKRIKNAATASATYSNSTSVSNYSEVRWTCRECLKSNFDSASVCSLCNSSKENKESSTGLEKLSQNFKDVLMAKKDTDLTIKVEGREFKVHELILRARSSVFDDMLSKTKRNSKTSARKKKTTKKQQESNENVIEIQDCDPEVFEEFLLFVYSGTTENMNSDNIFGLYDLAHKYNLPDLKSECIYFLEQNFSFENICDVISMATNHNETELLNLAKKYFAIHMDEILTTNNWLVFLQNDHVEANKLCLEALKVGFTKKE